MRGRIGVIYALCLSMFALAAVASEPAKAPSSCSSMLTGALSAIYQTNCFDGASCLTNQDCANLCSGYATATCVEEQCRYTYGSPGGGSGGSGGGGSTCFPTACQSYQECVCLRPDGIYDYGQCIQGTCQY